MSFGELLQRLRTERGLSKYALEKASDVPHANITQFESGKRGAPTSRTVFELAIGLGLDQDPHQSKEFLERALGERFLTELERFAIYYYLSLVSDAEVDRVSRYIRDLMSQDEHVIKALTPKGVRGHGEPSLYELLVTIAERPELAHLRRRLAKAIIKTVNVDLEHEVVNLRPGEIAQDLLERRGQARAESDDKSGAVARDEG